MSKQQEYEEEEYFREILSRHMNPVTGKVLDIRFRDSKDFQSEEGIESQIGIEFRDGTTDEEIREISREILTALAYVINLKIPKGMTVDEKSLQNPSITPGL